MAEPEGQEPVAPDADAAPVRAGFVALLGAPNVGKSSLLNRLVGTKVSIVSPKVQTTRRRVIGIAVSEGAQLVFVDTPGIFEPHEGRRLERAMVQAAWKGAAEADLVVAVVDARRGIERDTVTVLEGIAKAKTVAILAINKIDLVPPQRLLPLIQAANEKAAFAQTFLVSALDGHGVPELLEDIGRRLPEGPWLFPEDQLSDLSNRALAAELTREQIFLKLNQELPYSITVENEAWTESEDGSQVRIDQTIYVQRDSQKAIVLGKGGRQIKAIGEAARREIERALDTRIHLFLFVKVRERWTEDPERYRELGLDFDT